MAEVVSTKFAPIFSYFEFCFRSFVWQSWCDLVTVFKSVLSLEMALIPEKTLQMASESDYKYRRYLIMK